MSQFQLTAEQARATQPHSHVWVDASAGTGKTHVLSARVLRLMVEGAHPNSILCLTYTKAAAGEMTNRILSHLGRWATQADDALTTELATLLGGRSQVDSAAIERARRLFLDVLDLPSGLNVQTLHAFSQSLLGRFPIEARTAPGFETLDARTAEELLASSRDDLLSAAIDGRDPALSAAAHNLARLLSDKSFNETISALRHAGHRLAQLPKSKEGLLELVEGALGLKPGIDTETLLHDACKDSAFDAAGLRDVLAAINAHGTQKEKADKGQALAAWLSSDANERAKSFDAYALIFLTKTGGLRKGMLTKKPSDSLPSAADIMAREAERIVGIKSALKLKTIAQQTGDALLFGQALFARYGARKDNAAKLDFDDLIQRTRLLLETPDIPTWVMYKLDTQIDHILVDEAQDNSEVQWRIIDTLTQSFFDALPEGRQRSVFAVGDMKQSIYGFQGAKPKLFDDTRAAIKDKAGQIQQRFEDVPLVQSFRSVQAVLDVVDKTFEGAAGDGLDANRVTIKHRSFRAGVGGGVDLWPLTHAPKESEQDEGWRLPLFERTQPKADRALAQKIADDIASRIAAGECLPGRSAPLHAGDFLILVRRRGDFMGHMARALKRRSIALAGIDRFDLKSPLVIRDLINVARFASLPEDDFTLACVLKGPFCNISEEALMTLCTQRKGSLWDHIRVDGAVPEAVLERLRTILRRADYVPPFEFFSQLLLDGGRSSLLKRLGVEADDAIDVFLSQCLAYERDHAPSLDGFLHWFAQSDVDVQRDAEAQGDKVRIMTVHGAKGLQAPVVYLPDLVGIPQANYTFIDLEHVSGGKRYQLPILRRTSSNDVGPVGEAAQAKKQAEYEEYKRLLYVAMTRAEDHLICCGFQNQAPSDAKGQTKEARKDAYQLVADAFGGMNSVETLEDGVQRYSQAQSAPLKAVAADIPDPDVSPKTPAWLAQPAPQEATPPRPLQPSGVGLTAPKLFETAAPMEISPAQRGTVVHTLLEHLPHMAPPDREECARGYVKKTLATATETLVDDLVRQTLETLALPDLAPLFGPDSRTEVPLIARLGDFVVSGQIDRLSVVGDTVLFVDYKTTAAPPARADAIAPAYMTQMALYHAGLKHIFPGKTVRGALVWTVSGRIDWLERTQLMMHLPQSANSAFL